MLIKINHDCITGHIGSHTVNVPPCRSGKSNN